MQVKSVTDYGKATQTSAIRSTEFDQLLLVVFDPAIAVQSAHLYSKEQAIEAMGSRSEHTNARSIRLSAKALFTRHRRNSKTEASLVLMDYTTASKWPVLDESGTHGGASGQ